MESFSTTILIFYNTWGENCVRCHNASSPPAISDMQWETIALHMRVRANLTEEEVQKVVEFLYVAN